jgi:hypothetical protein
MNEKQQRELMMRELQSSNLAGYDYDAETKVLTVYFRGGRGYRYSGVEQEVVDGLEGAESPGKYFHARIREQYPFK